VSSSKPFHQTVLTWVAIGFAVLLALGAFLDSLSNTINWISETVTYVGTVVLLVGLAAVLAWLRRVGVSWTVGGQRTTLRGLGRYGTVSVVALVVMLWLPRAVERVRPPERTATPWAELLLEGEEMVVEIGEVPPHMGGGRGHVPHDATYRIRFDRNKCLWRTVGPWQFRPEEGGALVPDHVNEASPTLQGRLTTQSSQTGTSECNSPKEQRMVVMAVPVEFDRRGVISFGGKEHTIGALRVPARWDWPGTWWGTRYTGQQAR
jgi:hypothetical protein